MRRDISGRGAAAVAVLACLLVVGSALAVAPGTADAAHVTGQVSYAESDGELVVEVDVRDAANGSFTGGEETVTVRVGGTAVTPSPDAPGENASTYTYTIPQDDLAGIESLDGRDGSNTEVVVSHDGRESFNGTADLRYLALDGSGEFADGGLRFAVGTNFGVAAGASVPVAVDAGGGEQDVTATYRRSGAGNDSYLVVTRDTLRELGALENPGEITVSGGEPFVRGTATFDVRSAGAQSTAGERLSGGAVRFESPLFEAGRSYDVTVRTGGAQYRRSVEAGDRAITVDSRAVAAESSVDLTVALDGTTVVRTDVGFGTTAVTGNASGATVTFDSLPDRVGGANVSAVWVEAQAGVERYDARLNATSRTLRLSNAGSLPRPAGADETALLVQFEGAGPLHAVVALQSDGGTATQPGGDGSRSGSGLLDSGSPVLLAVIAIFGIGVVAVVVYVLLRTSDDLDVSPFGPSKGGSKREAPPKETAEASIKVVDELGGDDYGGATKVVARPASRDQAAGSMQGAGAARGNGPAGSMRGTGSTGTIGGGDPAGLGGVNADNGKRIPLSGGIGAAELEYGKWVFEVEENGRTVGGGTEVVDHETDGRQIALSVEPHVVEVVVTGGPDRTPAAGATVELRADVGGWTRRKPADGEGTVRFEVPRSASTVSVTATDGDLPPETAEHRIEQAVREGVTLRIADGAGAMTVETTVGDRPWPEVDVRITPTSPEAEAYTDEGTITTKGGGRRTVEGLPVGEYEVHAHPQLESVDTTAAVERVAVGDGDTVGVDLSIGISYTVSDAQRERRDELEGRIEELAAASNRDVAIPRYYGTVLASVLELVGAIEAAPERAVETGISPDAAVEALLDATETGISTVDAAMSERRNVKLFGACESMPPAEVEWDGAATLDGFLDGVNDGGDHERRALRDRLRAVDEVLDRKWGEVNELAPARKLHDRVGELARETGSVDDELAVVAQTYVGIHLLDAVEGIFDHDALVDRLNSGSY